MLRTKIITVDRLSELEHEINEFWNTLSTDINIIDISYDTNVVFTCIITYETVKKRPKYIVKHTS